jgi:hypothetical protein
MQVNSNVNKVAREAKAQGLSKEERAALIQNGSDALKTDKASGTKASDLVSKQNKVTEVATRGDIKTEDFNIAANLEETAQVQVQAASKEGKAD